MNRDARLATEALEQLMKHRNNCQCGDYVLSRGDIDSLHGFIAQACAKAREEGRLAGLAAKTYDLTSGTEFADEDHD